MVVYLDILWFHFSRENEGYALDLSTCNRKQQLKPVKSLNIMEGCDSFLPEFTLFFPKQNQAEFTQSPELLRIYL